MKKLLAMVLALVMTLSLAVSANAFTDDKSISDDYAEAVAVLNGMGVFKGYEDGSFKPEGNITRAEVATIIYRIYTADVAKNDKSGLYATYNKFSDMAGASWAAGYIGYCANASLVKGYPDGTFKPSGNVTGYEVLAMILRAVGYDKNNEFSGSDWALHVAQTAQQLGVLDNVAKTTDLNAPASRELVAELLFQGIQKAQVTYTPAFGYVTDKVIGDKNNSLGEKNFDLKSKDDADEWGRPGTLWSYNTGDKETLVLDKADATYTVATTECDIAHDLGLSKDLDCSVFVNGILLNSTYKIERLDTKTKIGAQGRLMEVYEDAKTIVMIDTFLAKVDSVKDATYDAQGHLKKDATITLLVYDQDTTKYTTLTLTNGDENYTYEEGDMVLVNAYTKTNTVTGAGKILSTNNDDSKQYAEIVGEAESVEGTQTVIWKNAAQHTVNGTTYSDAAEFNHNEADQESTATYAWYFDQYDNLIGAFEVDTQYSYAVLKDIVWINNGLKDGYATGTLVYMDGSENEVTIDKIDGATTTYSYDNNSFGIKGQNSSDFYVTTNPKTNAKLDGFHGDTLHEVADYIDGHLYQVYTNSKGNVELTTVTGNDGHTEIYAKVYNKGTKIGSVKVDSNTLFLVGTPDSKDVYSYEKYEGINNVPTFSNSKVKVDYVLGDNNVAKYVYIIGTPDAAEVKDLVLITSRSYKYTIDDGVYELNLNTAEGTVVVKTEDKNANGEKSNIVDTLTSKDAVDKLFYITYQDDMAVEVEEITKIQNVGTDSEGNALKAALLKEVSYANSVLTGTTVGDRTFTYNTTNAEIVGDYSSLTNNMDFENVRVYVVFKLNDDQNQREAVKVYAIDVDDSTDASGNPTDEATDKSNAVDAAAIVDGKALEASVESSITTPANVKAAVIAAVKEAIGTQEYSYSVDVKLPVYEVSSVHGILELNDITVTVTVGEATATATVSAQVAY